jgi:hypothetical protein
LAAKKGNLGIMKDLWELAVEKLTVDEQNNKLLLGKDREEKPLGTWQQSTKN